MAGAAPLYGTLSTLKPARLASTSPAMWPSVPVPASACLISPGLALAAATSSASDLYGASVRTTSTTGCEATTATGTRSFSAS